jgi:hypothetical protein
MKELPTLKELNKRYTYNPETGVLVSNKTKRPTKAKNPKGYLIVTVDFKTYMAHRIIWKLMTGEDPGDRLIDHENRIRDDNRWSNLRLIDTSGNNFNNGSRGYSREGNRWRVRLTYKNKLIIHKFFVEEQDAIDAVKEARENILHKTQRDGS